MFTSILLEQIWVTPVLGAEFVVILVSTVDSFTGFPGNLTSTDIYRPLLGYPVFGIIRPPAGQSWRLWYLKKWNPHVRQPGCPCRLIRYSSLQEPDQIPHYSLWTHYRLHHRKSITLNHAYHHTITPPGEYTLTVSPIKPGLHSSDNPATIPPNSLTSSILNPGMIASSSAQSDSRKPRNSLSMQQPQYRKWRTHESRGTDCRDADGYEWVP